MIQDQALVTRFFDPEQLQRYKWLRRRYGLNGWECVCNFGEYNENLYVLDILDRYISCPLAEGPGLEIGCRSFDYLPALYAFHRQAWDGVELDAYARFRNFMTLRACGEYMARQCSSSRYIAGSVLQLQGRYSFICWFLPFLFQQTQTSWGLPSRFFQPAALLAKAYELLTDGGVLLVINQGDGESAKQGELFDMLSIDAAALGEVSSIFSPFYEKRLGWLLRK